MELHHLALDPAEQRARIGLRQAQAPHTTWPMSDEELTAWAGQFEAPTPGELDGSEPVGDPPDGAATWEQWRAARWPDALG